VHFGAKRETGRIPGTLAEILRDVPGRPARFPRGEMNARQLEIGRGERRVELPRAPQIGLRALPVVRFGKEPSPLEPQPAAPRLGGQTPLEVQQADIDPRVGRERADRSQEEEKSEGSRHRWRAPHGSRGSGHVLVDFPG
jgi:hypothetical protein